MAKAQTINLAGGAARGFMIGMYQDKIDKLEKRVSELRDVADCAVDVWNAQAGGVDNSNGVKFAHKMFSLRDALIDAGFALGDISAGGVK